MVNTKGSLVRQETLAFFAEVFQKENPMYMTNTTEVYYYNHIANYYQPDHPKSNIHLLKAIFDYLNQFVINYDAKTKIYTFDLRGDRQQSVFTQLDSNQVRSLVRSVRQFLSINYYKEFDEFNSHYCKSENYETYLYFNTKNCVVKYEPETNRVTVEKHHPKFLFTSRLEVHYDPEDKPDQWLSALNQVLASKKDVEFLRSYLAYCLIPDDFSWEVAAVFYGIGANGKSTVAGAFSKLFSKVSNLKLNQMQQRFALSGATNANFMWANESNKAKVETEYLKSIISGERVFIDRKGIPGADYLLLLKILITLNQLPFMEGKADKRRMLIFFFGKIFSDDDDIDMKDKLINNLSGLFNWLLPNIKYYQENIVELKKGIDDRWDYYYEKFNDPFGIFYDEFIIETGNRIDELSTQRISYVFNFWGDEYSHDKLTNNQIGKRLSKMHSKSKTVEGIRTIDNGKRCRGYAGLKLDPEKMEEINIDWTKIFGDQQKLIWEFDNGPVAKYETYRLEVIDVLSKATGPLEETRLEELANTIGIKDPAPTLRQMLLDGQIIQVKQDQYMIGGQ